MNTRVSFLLPRFVFILLWLAVAISLRAQGTAEIRGRVTIAGGLTGVEGATVTLDASPADGNPERSARTDPFGFYTLIGVTAGSYRFEARHPAFISHQADLTLSASERSQRLVALAPLGDFASRFDIVVRVADVTSGLVLGDVPVAALRFNAAGDASPAETSVASTAANGTVTFRGALAGYYRFRINSGSDGAVKPKWEAYTTEGTANDRKHLTQPHMLNMLLKPIPQNLTIQVRGFDPKAGPEGTANAPLAEVYVEATGVDPGNLASEVVPVRVGTTDSEGNITFQGLPSIAWKIRAKKLGYEPSEIVVSRDSVSGLLPVDPVVVNLTFRQTALRAVLSSPYYFGLLTHLNVRLAGLAGTGTEGIVRTNVSVWTDGLQATCTISNLAPGRYEVLVRGTNTSPVFRSGFFQDRTFTAAFHGRRYAEALLGTTQSVSVPMQIQPAVIRGRLLVAEQTSRYTTNELIGSQYYKGGAPAYQPQGHTNILFKQSAEANYIDTFTGSTNNNTFIARAETNGEFTLTISPGSYGVVLPGLDGYVGTSARQQDLTAGTSADEPWPFYHSQFSSGVSFPFTAHHGLGLPFSSGHEYQFDLFVRKQVYDVQGFVADTSGGQALTLVQENVEQNINRVTIGYSDLAAGGLATLNGNNGVNMTNALRQWILAANAELRPDAGLGFRDVPPGTYSVQVQHPRYTATVPGSGAAAYNLNLPVWGNPGVILPDDWQNNATQFPMDNVVDIGGFSNPTFDAARNSTVTLPETTAYRFTLTAVSSEDPSLVVPNTTVVLDGTHNVTAPFDNAAFNGDYLPDQVNHPSWVLDTAGGIGNYQTVRLLGQNHVDVKLFLKRGMGVSGLVAITNGGGGLANAPVIIRDIHGQHLRRAATTNDGGYQVSQALKTAQTLFVEVRVPGYYPSRVRAVPDPSSATPNTTATNLLTPLPLPVVTNAAVDRFGLFLPGISRAGNQGAYLDATAQQALTMTWTARVQTATLTYQLPDFNTPDGSPRLDRTFNIPDALEEVWFIDTRSFATNTYASPPVDLVLPNFNVPEEAQAWLRKIADGTFPNVFHQRVTSLGYDESRDEFTASGKVGVNQLPPGELQPLIVAVTENGAINATRITYPQAETQKRLRGVRLPASMSFFSDIISLIASTVGNNLEIEKAAPKGRFLPLPQFNSSITTNVDGFMDYSWSMGVKWEDGQVGPQSGILKLGAKKLGLAFDTGIKLEADGAADHFVLGRDASFGAPRASRLDYAPDDAKDSDGNLKKAKADFLWNITAGVSESVEFNSQVYPNEQRVSTYANGYIGAAFEYKLFSTAFVVPPVGAILATFDVSLDVNATASAIIGAAITNQWTTVFPRLEETGLGRSYQTGGTSEQPPRDTNVVHQLQRHFLGGRELSRSFALCYNLNAGLEARLARIASVRGGLTLQGNECQLGGIGNAVPSVLLEINPTGDFPYIKRMSGTFNAYLEADLNLYLARVGKRWNWPLYEFDYQYGTTPVFQLIPMGISQTLATPAGGTAVTFLGSGQTLLQNFFPGGSFHAASGAADALVFTNIDPGSGNMLLKVSLRGLSGDFAAPILIGSAGGIVALDLAPLPTGGWMVVWTQIEQADVGNPFAAGTIMFSVSNGDGSSWSAPAVVAALTDVATDLRLVTTSTLVGLAYLHTADGPMATRYSLKAASWNGTTWSGPTSIFTDGTVSAFDAVGSGPAGTAPAVMAVSDASGNLNAFTWNGAVVTGPTLAATNAGNSIDLTVNVQQQFFLASALRDGGVGLLRFDTTNGWADLGTPFSNAVPSELHITPVPDTDTTVYLITWPQGSPAAPIWYGFTDANGVPLKGPINLTPEATGVYSHLHALPKPGKEARIIARRDDGSVSIVQLDVAFAGIRPRLEQFSLLSGTGFAFTLTGDNSLDYRIQGAADLATWTTLTNLSGTNLPYFFLDPAALGLPHRFYRAVSP